MVIFIVFTATSCTQDRYTTEVSMLENKVLSININDYANHSDVDKYMASWNEKGWHAVSIAWANEHVYLLLMEREKPKVIPRFLR